MSYRGRGVSPSLAPSDSQFSPLSAIHSQAVSRSPETKAVRRGNALHSKSSRRYPAEPAERAVRAGEDSVLAPRGSVQAVRNESPINVRTFKLVAKPVSPEKCKHCHNAHCVCKPASQEPPKRLLSSKAPRTSNPTPVRSSKQSDSRLHQSPEQAPESDLEASSDVGSNPDSSFDVDTSAVIAAHDCGSPERDIGKHVQLPSIAQSTRLEPAKRPKLLKSIYCSRPATVLFDYPPQCLQPPRASDRVIEMSDEEMERCPLTFKVSDSVHTYNCFVNAYVYNGFTQTTSSNFNMLMSSPPKPEYLMSFNPYQRMNHYPGAWQFGRKDNLWRNVGRMRRKFGRDYEICPMTYILPEDYKRFETEREEDPKAFWIRKPVASSCGRGIKVISGTAPVKKRQ